MLNELDSESEFLTKTPNTHSHLETNQNLSKCTNNSRNMKCSDSNKMLAENADSHTLQDFAPTKNEVSFKFPTIYLLPVFHFSFSIYKCISLNYSTFGAQIMTPLGQIQ